MQTDFTALWKIFTETAAIGLDLASIGPGYFQLQIHYRDLLKVTPDGDGRPILVLPGFGGHDLSTLPLRNFLQRKGYAAYGWDGGINRGPDQRTLRHMISRVDEIREAHRGRKVQLIGHSLGGFYARELNRAFPEKTRCPITLGTPFGGANNREPTGQVLRTAFEFVNGSNKRVARDEKLLRQAALPPPAHTTSIYTSRDGVVDWSTCLNPKGERQENIEINTTHCGLIFHPLSLIVIADRLAQRSGHWKPFHPEKYATFPLKFNQDQAHLHCTVPKLRSGKAMSGIGLFAGL